MWRVVFAKQAAKDAELLKGAGLDVKAKGIIEIVKKNPFETPPSYEALVGSLSDLCSRRINLRHRFVYAVLDGPVDIGGGRITRAPSR